MIEDLEPRSARRRGRPPLSEALTQRLEPRLARCQARAQALAETLETEAQRLAQRELGELEALLRQKGAQVEGLEEAERQLRRVLEEAGYPPGAGGVRRLLRSAPKHLQEAWRELESLLRTIQARNEANGRLIHRNLEQTQRLLDLATGAHERADEMTYGTHGEYTPGNRSRRITQA